MSRPFGSIYDDSPNDIGREWNDAPSWRPNGHDVKVPPQIEFKTLADFCREYVPLAYAVEPLLRTSALYTLTSTLRILCRVAERFRESFHEGGWNFYTVRRMPRH